MFNRFQTTMLAGLGGTLIRSYQNPLISAASRTERTLSCSETTVLQIPSKMTFLTAHYSKDMAALMGLASDVHGLSANHPLVRNSCTMHSGLVRLLQLLLPRPCELYCRHVGL